MSVSIKPLEDRIVIKQVEAEQTTASGLVIPDTAKEKPQEGEVVAVGPGRIDDNGNRVPLDVAVGDKVHLLQVRRHRGQVRRRGLPRPVGPRRARGRRPLTTARFETGPDASRIRARRVPSRSPATLGRVSAPRRVRTPAVASGSDATAAARPRTAGRAWSTRSPRTCSGASCPSTSSRWRRPAPSRSSPGGSSSRSSSAPSLLTVTRTWRAFGALLRDRARRAHDGRSPARSSTSTGRPTCSRRSAATWSRPRSATSSTRSSRCFLGVLVLRERLRVAQWVAVGVSVVAVVVLARRLRVAAVDRAHPRVLVRPVRPHQEAGRRRGGCGLRPHPRDRCGSPRSRSCS